MTTEPKELIKELLATMGFEVEVEEKEFPTGPLYDIKSDESGRLIGRQGATLADLQYLVNRMLFRDNADSPKITLDVGGYRSKAQQALVDKAQDGAEKAKKNGDLVELEPMNSFDRYVVHNALKDDDEIETSSVEIEGSTKKVIIIRPKRA
ncbi:MAG: protein jag [Limisphaerales bacterium]